MENKFAVVDVETTGGHAEGHGMTEIAIVCMDGGRIVDRFSSLLDPGRPIPPFITRLTGITDEMVASAPSFAEVAGEVCSLLEGRVFVAHNVNFDYSFVRRALAAEGKDFNPRRLCTVRYARKIKPGLTSYSLGNLCSNFGLVNRSPHRALGDAEVTAELLQLLLAGDDENMELNRFVNKQKGMYNLPPGLNDRKFAGLPEDAGVYYFYNERGEVIYIGKAKNIKKRVSTHFTAGKTSFRHQAFQRQISDIKYEKTGTELMALLIEEQRIRKFWPRYNRSMKKRRRLAGVFAYTNGRGIWHLAVNDLAQTVGALARFQDNHGAVEWVYRQMKRYELHPAYCHCLGDYEGGGLEDHNRNFERMLDDLRCAEVSTCYLPAPGEGEKAFVMHDEVEIKAFGFVPENVPEDELQEHNLRKYFCSYTPDMLENGSVLHRESEKTVETQ